MSVTYAQLQEMDKKLDPWVSWLATWSNDEISESWLMLQEAASALQSAQNYDAAMECYRLLDATILEARKDWLPEHVEAYLDYGGQREYYRLIGEEPPKAEREVWEVTLRIDAPTAGTVVDDYGSMQVAPSDWRYDMMFNNGESDPKRRYKVTTVQARKIG